MLTKVTTHSAFSRFRFLIHSRKQGFSRQMHTSDCLQLVFSCVFPSLTFVYRPPRLMEVMSLSVNTGQRSAMVTLSRLVLSNTLRTTTPWSGRCSGFFPKQNWPLPPKHRFFFIFCLQSTVFNIFSDLRLIVCMMSSSQPNTAGPECFESESLDYQPVQASTFYSTLNWY